MRRGDWCVMVALGAAAAALCAAVYGTLPIVVGSCIVSILALLVWAEWA